MKKLFLLLMAVNLLFAADANSKVLFVVNSDTYWSSLYLRSHIQWYIADVNKIDHKDTSVVIYDYYNQYTSGMYDRCYPLWQLLRDSCQANFNTSHPIEGVVLIGNLPSAWCSDNYSTHSWGFNVAPDDRYFMDLYDAQATPVHFYATTELSQIWQFDAPQNIFTAYFNRINPYNPGSISDGLMDIWVSRIMAHQIRAARGPYYGWQYAEDENAILIDYFLRLRDRMRAPAKVPPRGFSMGAITDWANHDAVTKLGMLDLNLQRVFNFDFMESSPANYLLQLTKGPRGGTTLGAYNGERYADIGRNNITNIYNSLTDRKTGNAIPITDGDTTGYEWAGLYEHSDPWSHMFNMNGDGACPNGKFSSLTYGKQWSDANWLQPSGGLYNGSYYKYNHVYDDNPYHTDLGPFYCARDQFAIFKAAIAPAQAGDYTVWMYAKADTANTPNVYGSVNAVPVNHDFLSSGGLLYPFGGISQIPGEFIQIVGPNPPNQSIAHFNANDTAWIELSTDGNSQPGYLIADVVLLLPTGSGDPIIIDNTDIGATGTRFISTNWINRNFLDMQDEDPVDHAAYSKVPFFINTGCNAGNYYLACYDPTDFMNNTLTAQVNNNLGLLYGMTHGGLVSFTSGCSYPSSSYYTWAPFTIMLSDPSKTFGDAALAITNTHNSIPYVLIGAGTLKASAYIPYGTTMQTLMGITISTTGQLYNYPGQLVWMENFNVTATGGCTVQGMEVRVYAESDLKGEVDLKSGI